MTVGARPRTQEERRAETRAKLLDATIQSILDAGYAQTTTRGVAELAGVSAGAQAYHFPRRVDLVVAAAEELVERRVERSREGAKGIKGSPRQRFTQLLDLMWEDFSGPIFAVFVKLWAAAADEPELYQSLVAGERRIARLITELADDAAGDIAPAGDADAKLLLVFSALRGLALTQQFEPRGSRRRDPWPQLRGELLAALTASDGRR